MTDREELVKLADEFDEIEIDADGKCDWTAVANAQTHLRAQLRRLASSDGGVKGEPEPVAWPSDGGCVRCGAVPRTASGLCNTCLDEDAERYENAPPADAGMREAFVRVLASLAAAISILERTPKAKKAVASDKMFDTMLDDYRKALEAGRKALTAPGATTKSDEPLGRFGHHPIPADDFLVEVECIENEWSNIKVGFTNGTPTRDELEQRLFRAMQFRVGGDAACVDAKAALRKIEAEMHAPSDPSSTRSEVTVEELADWLFANLRTDTEPHQDARALLDQF